MRALPSLRPRGRTLAVGAFVLAALAVATVTSSRPVGAQEPVGGGDGSFSNPRAIAVEPSGDFVVADFANGNIVRVDGETGDRRLLSDSGTDVQGPRLIQPAGIVALPDGRIFVSDLARAAVYEIDPIDGRRTLRAGEDGSIISPFGLAAGIIRHKTMLVVADTGNPEGGAVVGPVLVDPDTGAVSHIKVKPDNTILFNDPRAVAVIDGAERRRGTSRDDDDEDRDGRGGGVGRILVANFGEGTIISVDPVSGTRKTVSRNPSAADPGVGTGVAFGSMSDMAIARDGKRLFVVDLGTDALVEVDLKTGNRTVVSTSAGTPVGTGAEFRSPHGIELIDDDEFMVTDFGLPGLVFVARNGDRTVFSSTPVQGFVGIRAIDVLTNGGIVAADFAGNRIFFVDPVTGERTPVSSGSPFNGPVAAIELDADTLAVAQFQNPPGIFFVDKATGERAALTGFGRGTGPTLASRGFILDPNDPNRILATSVNEDAVIAVDIATGDRTFVSKAGERGAGGPLNSPAGIAVDPADGTMYVSDFAAQVVWRISPNGDRTILASNGSAPLFGQPFGISLIDGELWVADSTGLFKVDRVTGAKTLISAGGQLFTVRKRDGHTVFVSNFGPVNGIEIVDKITGARSILSNADVP